MIRFFVFVLLLTFVLQAPAQTIRIATYQYSNDTRLQSLQPFAEHLKRKYKYSVALKSYPSVQALITAIRKNEVDIALINTSGYLLLEASGKDYPMQPVATLKVPENISDGYRTAIIAGPKVTVSRLEDLKKQAANLRVTFVNTGSTSGNLVPRMAMANAGITSPEKTFKDVLYSDIHDAAVDAVLLKMADVGAVGFSEYQKYLQQDSRNRSKMRLLWLSPEIPFGPILFNRRFGSAVGGELLNAFIKLHEENRSAFEAMKAGWSETKTATRFVKINSTYYNTFRKSLGKEQDIQRILKQALSGSRR
jgi:phosphonate transport system substrate-binding protein